MGRWMMLLAAADGPAKNLSIFSPASPAADSIVRMAVLTLAVSALILAVVEGVLLYSLWRFRDVSGPGRAAGEPAQVYGSQPIEIAWTAAPLMIVFFLTMVITRTLWEAKAASPAADRGADPAADPAAAGEHALRVTVIGRQWWWEFAYESYDGRKLEFAAANELHIPVSEEGAPRPVYLRLESADVCHSFWAPRLGGKVDLIPGRTNMLVLRTSEAGLYLGQCAEYCGTQHANMLLRVVADPPDAFDRWLAAQAAPAVDDPAERAGRDAFLAQSCVNCHRVRGTRANGTYAPDLTHLMSRETLASGEIENSPDQLARWVRDPQSIKPGCLMPAFGLSAADQKLIVRYLLSLR